MFNLTKPLRAAFIVCTLFSTACGVGNDAKIDSSKSVITEEIGDNAFRNEFFGLTVSKPESWHALDQQQQLQLMGLGGDIATSGNDDLKRVVDATAKNNHPLFAFFMYELGSPVTLNPSVIGLAENIGLMTGVKTGRDYFFHAKKLLSQTGMNYEISEEYGERVIGGVTFDSMEVRSNFNGTPIEQTYYAARHDNFVISIIETHGADESAAAISEIIDSIKFDW